MKIAEKRYTYRVQIIATPEDWPSEAFCGRQKVNQKHLSKLMRSVLGCIDSADGTIERGELVAAHYDVGGRRYRSFYVDPCFGKTESRRYNRCYKRAQPAISRCLKKLESRGLVRLIRHRKYVKKIELTAEGRMLVESLIKMKGKYI